MAESIFDNMEESMFEFIFQDNLNLIRLSRPVKPDNDDENYNLPDQKGIIIKTTFVVDEGTGRRFPNKSYYEYDPATFSLDIVKKDKRSISVVLKDSLINYIKSNNSLNNYFSLIEKSITKKSNAVKYEVKFSDYISFNIILKPSELDVEDVSYYITSLPIEKLKAEKKDPWKVELAKSSRAKCQSCKQKIEKATIRIGQPSYFQEHLSYAWHHLDCIKDFSPNVDLIGLNDLNDEQQQLVQGHLYSKNELTKPLSQQSKDPKKILKDFITKYEDTDGLTAQSDVYKFGKELNLAEDNINKILKEMEDEGELYYPDQGKIKLI